MRVLLTKINRRISARAVRIALGAETRENTFYVGRSSALVTSDWSHVERFSDHFTSVQEVKIKQYIWSDFIEQHSKVTKSHYDIIKIDAEGTDFEILDTLIVE